MLGIDPGLQATGWGIVSYQGGKLAHHGHGIIRTNARDTDPKRLTHICTEMGHIVADYQPAEAMIEEIFVVHHLRSVLKLGMARAAAIIACGMAGLPVSEISARKVKQTITGTGRADKKQIAYMIARLLNIAPPSADAADALAIAISGVQNMGRNLGPVTAPKLSATAALSKAIEAALAREKQS